LNEEAIKKSRNMALRILTYRARSEKEIYDYIERKGFSKPVIDKTITDMKEYGLIDDQKFAADFINYRKNHGYGFLKIRYELIMKGIDKNIIDSQIEASFNADEDLFRIRMLLSKRTKPAEAIDDKWLMRQTLFLKRRGFQDSLILKALKEYPVNDNISE